MAKEKKLIIIDAQAVLHRAWHALPPLTNPQGQTVNAVYGFTSLLLKLIREQEPLYLAVAFDTKAPTFRHKEYKEYKAGREKQPNEFYDQIPLTKNLLKSFDFPVFEKDGFEADDLIGTIIKKMGKQYPEINSLIVTGDLDLCQLIDKNTFVYFIRQGISQIKIYGIKEVKERFELSPEQLIDFKALKGDPSDNIKGLEGVGEKTALSLIQKFKNLESIYSHLEKCLIKKQGICEIRTGLAKHLWENKTHVFREKKLVKIETNISGLDIKKIKPIKLNSEKIIKAFENLGFNSLIKRIETNGFNQPKLF